MQQLTFTGYERTKKARYSLFFDNSFLMSISEDCFAACKLVKGESYPLEYIEQLRLDDEYISCRQRAMTILSSSAQTEYRLRQKLSKYFCTQAVDAAVERMCQLGLLNDADYARKYTADAVSIKGMSKRRIEYELRQRGIAREIVQQATENIAECAEVESIVRLIEKRYSHKLGSADSKQKVIAALARRGFSFSAIKEAILQFTEQCDIAADDDFV